MRAMKGWCYSALLLSCLSAVYLAFATQAAAEVQTFTRNAANLHRRGLTRQLMQTSCSALSSAAADYNACHSLEVSTGDFVVLWSLTSNGTGGYIMNATIDSSWDGWVGFGFPDYPGNMIGTNAFLLYPCSTCPTGANISQHHLEGFEPDEVLPNLGKLPEKGPSSGRKSGSRISGSFSVLLPDVAVANLKRVDVLHAAGFMEGDLILEHPTREAHGAILDLSEGTSTAGAPAQGPAARTGIESAGGSTAPGGAPAPAPVVAPAPASSTVTCGVERGTYAQCENATSLVRADYNLLYTFLPANSSTGKPSMDGKLVVKSGWGGAAFPRTPGVMVESLAVIVSKCSTCPTGAKVDFYSLNDQTTSGVVPTTALKSLGTPTAAAAADGTLRATFAVELPDYVATPEKANMLYAVGPVVSGDRLGPHSLSQSRGVTLNLLSGTSEAGAQPSNEYTVPHGLVMAICWGLIIPAGAVVARSFKGSSGLWFQMHRVMQVLGFLGGIAGLVLGLKINYTNSEHQKYDAHKAIGITVVALGALQATALLFRPKPDSSNRKLWKVFHHNGGRIAILLAIVNVYLGLSLAGEASKWYIAYSVLLGAVVVVGLAKDAWTLSTPKGSYPQGTLQNRLGADGSSDGSPGTSRTGPAAI